MLSLRYYLETMKTSLDVVSKTYLINDNGEFYTGDNMVVPSLLIRVNLNNIYECIGKTVYVQYQGMSCNLENSLNFKTYYQTKIVDIINYQGVDYIKFNTVSVLNFDQKQVYPNNEPLEFCYMRISTIPLIMIFS